MYFSYNLLKTDDVDIGVSQKEFRDCLFYTQVLLLMISRILEINLV